MALFIARKRAHTVIIHVYIDDFHEVSLGIAPTSVPPVFLFLNTSPRVELVQRYGMYKRIQHTCDHLCERVFQRVQLVRAEPHNLTLAARGFPRLQERSE